MESDRIDALAISARAIPGPRSERPQQPCRKDVPHLSESLSLESRTGDLSTGCGGKIQPVALDLTI
jgi:hypothetical protein